MSRRKKKPIQFYLQGFTLLELILYIAILVIMMSALIPFAWNVIEGGAKSSVEEEVFSQGEYVSERLKYEIRNATGINFVTASQISLAEANPAANPTVITLNSGNITIQQGNGSQVPINSQNTAISNLTFTNHSSLDGSTENIQFVFTIAAHYNGAGSRQEYNASTSIDGDAEVRVNSSVMLGDHLSDGAVGLSSDDSFPFSVTAHPSMYLIVTVGTSGATVTGMSDNGISMTKLAAMPCSSGCNEELWYLKDPVPGINTVHITFSATTNSFFDLATFYNMNQSTPFGSPVKNTQTSTTVSSTVTTTGNGQLVIDGVGTSVSGAPYSPSGTQLYTGGAGTVGGAGSYTAGLPGNTIMSWTNGSGTWSQIAVALNP